MTTTTFIYDVASATIAIFIVLFSSVTFYWGIRYLMITKIKKHFDGIILIQTVIALAWVIMFGYITKQSLTEVIPIEPLSFGRLFIRPVILLSSSTMSIWMYIRYQFEKSGRSDAWNLQKN